MLGLRWSCRQVCPGEVSSSLLNSTLSSVAAVFARSITTRKANGGFHSDHVLPQLLPFQLTDNQARAAFNAWHGRHPLSPGGLLAASTRPMRQALLPFWLFEATVHVQYKGTLGSPLERKAMEWRETQWQERGVREYPWTMPSMQIYASYKYRRDLVEAVKLPGMLGRSRPLTSSEADAQEAAVGANEERVAIDPPDMRQSIGWHFARMAMIRQESAEAARLLMSETGCKSVRDVQIRLKTLKRRTRLLYVPAFVVDYVYGEHFNVHGVRHPEQFQAVISGLQGAGVAAERHFSPQKVQIAAAAAMGLFGTAAATVGLSGIEGHTLLSPASLLAALMVCTSAGLAARLSPLLLRQQAEDQRILVEDADMEKIMSKGLGPHDVLDDKHEEIRGRAEWRRWEEANKWAWDCVKRRRWAESLWRRQQERRLQRHAFERNKVRFEFEQQAEARRRARWGHSSHHTRFQQGDQNVFLGSESGGGRKDFLGYYALLGLDGDLGSSIAQSEIKRAFREAALRWHPDRLHVDDDSERQRAHDRFAKVKKAYEVLRNPDSRRDYDSGLRDYA